MKNLGNYSHNKQSAENVESSLVEVVFKSDSSRGVEPLELIKLGSSNCGSNTGGAARTFTGFNGAAVTRLDAAHFTGMDGAGVIATWGGSYENMDFSAGDFVNYKHGELDIDFANFMPANLVAVQGIDNQKSLVKENNFGMNEDNVKNAANYQAPGDGARSVSKSVINNVDVNQSANGKKCAESHDVTTSWSKGLQIRHLAIISRNEIEQERRAA